MEYTWKYLWHGDTLQAEITSMPHNPMLSRYLTLYGDFNLMCYISIPNRTSPYLNVHPRLCPVWKILLLGWKILLKTNGGQHFLVKGYQHHLHARNNRMPHGRHTECKSALSKRGIMNVDRKPNWCRFNLEYHNPHLPFLMPS